MNEDMCPQLRMSASEETWSHVQEEITEEDVSEWIPQRRCSRLGVVLSLPCLLWARTHGQVLPVCLGEVQSGRRRVHHISECEYLCGNGGRQSKFGLIKLQRRTKQQRNTTGTNVQQERVSANKLLTKAADALSAKGLNCM